ncbi:MAG TPA: A/G-specific adenine glycosylase [Verrucomicrobiae bacterium]
MPPVHKISAIVENLLIWFTTNARALPWRRTRDPYAIWVSEIMLQQTQVKTVIPYWERWMRELPTIADLAKVNPDKLHKLWEGLGYYTRVRNLQKAAQQILERHDGKFPTRHEQILDLSGIGPYTAGAICSIAFNQPTPILDGNVIRVLARVYAIRDNAKDKATNQRLWSLAREWVTAAAQVPKHPQACSHLNQALMELGALVCTPRQPQCLLCPLQKSCAAHRDGIAEELPNLGKRVEITARRFFAFVICHQGKLLVQQRPAGVVNAQLWEFPNVEVGLKSGDPAEVLAEMPFAAGETPSTLAPVPLKTIKHSITRYRITMEGFLVPMSTQPSLPPAGRWVTPAQLDSLAFASAHKKLASAARQSILSDR